ncbi:MAG: MotA/TolQ/ExbB proton channel family protein [Halobacteriovoraceae bacterium]|nr:MotA/TolQ/ExbB proton channel family protein [Halobacteriovoraceae bacterium]
MGTFEYLAKFMDDGGIFMWIILAVWIFAVVVSFERFKALLKYDTDGTSFMHQIRKFALDNEIHHAINLCSQSPSLLARVLKNGLKRANQSRQQIQDIVEATIIEANSLVEKRISYIALVANISTLMGLLGTIYGLIQSFAAVASADPSEKATLLAQGISKAMNTTAFGLISAISLLVIHSYLTNKAQKIVTDIDENAMKLIDVLGTKKNAEYNAEDVA